MRVVFADRGLVRYSQWLAYLFTLVVLVFTSHVYPVFAADEPHPPIGLPFHLDRPSFVTLVIEDDSGQRVRNLIAETHFEAGDHTVWWDGLDETPGNFRGPVYDTQGKPVLPGTYRVRGLARDALTLKHEFTVYNAGVPPWRVGKDREQSGEWLADHAAPSSVLYVPSVGSTAAQMLIGSQVPEHGDGLVWTDLTGRKLHGIRGVGGAWTGAHYLCRDTGATAVAGNYAYSCSTWKTNDPTKSELRLMESSPGSTACPVWSIAGRVRDISRVEIVSGWTETRVRWKSYER
jgi:hypothetical protein